MAEQNLTKQARGSRIIYVEAMRLAAIFFVIFTHTEYEGYFLYSRYPAGSLPFWGYMIPSAFCGFAVPVFFAVSGALMLDRKEEPLWDLWTKRVLKYGVMLVLVSFFYYWAGKDFRLHEVNPKTFLIVLYAYSSGTVTWFMYSYLAYLITLPLLKAMVRNLKDVYFLYLFALALVFKTLVPMAEYLIWQGDVTLNSSFSVDWLLGTPVLYPIMGYYIEHRMQHRHRGRTLLLLWSGVLAVLAAVCAMTWYFGQVEGAYLEGVASRFYGCLKLLTCPAVYLTLKYGLEDRCLPVWAQKLVRSGGACTFGVFAFHMHVIDVPTSRKVQRMLLNTGMDPMAAAFLFCLYVLAVCWAGTWVLRKIPLVRKLL